MNPQSSAAPRRITGVQHIAGVFQSRGVVLTMGLLALGAAIWAFTRGVVQDIPAGVGVLFPTPSAWFSQWPVASMWLGIALTVGIAAEMVIFNVRYNVTRSLSISYAGTFLVMQAGTPGVFARFCGPSVMAALALTSAILLISVYNGGTKDRRPVFLAFTIVTAGALTLSSCLVLLPVMLIALVPLRCMDGRSLMAAILGMVFPVAVVLGVGCVWTDLVPLPDISCLMRWSWRLPPLPIVVSCAVGVGVMLGAYAGSFMKLITYKAFTRAANGTLMMVGVISFVGMAIDWHSMGAFLPTVNVVGAFQLSHFTTHHGGWTSLSTVVIVFLFYTFLYVWQTFLPALL